MIRATSLALLWFATSAMAGDLMDARKGHHTKLTVERATAEGFSPGPPSLMQRVDLDGPAGALKAWVGPPVRPGAGKGPALVWILGGFPSGGGGELLWSPADPHNDQSAVQYRLHGVPTLYPTLRGSYGNGGHQESFYGEVDDVLAYVGWLKKQPWVDPDQVYVGGHSTGGTLALLVAASGEPLAGVIAFGPSPDPAQYGQDNLTYDVAKAKEARLRAPVHYLDAVTAPTWIVEGQYGNAVGLRALDEATDNPKIRFVELSEEDHFSFLATANDFFGARIAAGGIDAPPAELEAAMAAHRVALREAAELMWLGEARGLGMALDQPAELAYFVAAYSEAEMTKGLASLTAAGFALVRPAEERQVQGTAIWAAAVTKTLVPGDLEALFAAAEAIDASGLEYAGWEPMNP